MKRIALLIAGLVAGLTAATALAKPVQVNWTDLVGETAEIADPFESLPSDQMDALRKVLRLEWIGNEESASQAVALRAELTAQGLDVDALFAARIEIMEQRIAAASAVNQGLIGREIRIPGYILPLEFDGLEVVEFLLVPTVGACIHTPPPPANQMIHVLHPEGVEVRGLYDPVWITGVMEAEESLQDVRYSDGQASVEISYKMRPTKVEPY
ncbi:MAG: DUF3299 domain-containing protein [Rhodobacteraceae bacterium]|nr:DUF3299 domain-containing protein [Paracoccaceae bacterium]